MWTPSPRALAWPAVGESVVQGSPKVMSISFSPVDRATATIGMSPTARGLGTASQFGVAALSLNTITAV
jgi:hypothetical protein